MCISREDANKEDIIRCPEEEGVINIGSQCVTVQSEKKNYQWKMTETVAYGYSSESTQRLLSNEYQNDRV